ncbi:glycosyltransferase [Sphingomonas qilianensis]|uniref:Glycosyltransferase n=2 Tax=Sphingomonas qilianensis TaxID=1736690 RepID=A0ABU9XUP7_9SPHN
MSPYRVDGLELPSQCAAVVAVAVPACNEAGTIEACIRALDIAAANAGGATVQLVLLVNNSSDDTAARARRYRARAMRISVVEIALPPQHAHAGGARRAALDHATTLLPAHGILMTTDADSRVDPQWIAATLAELAAGADAVAGAVAFDEADLTALPPLPLRALEWHLAGLQARLGTLLDPRAHDPWPNHIWAWGASLALTVSAYRRVGGLPSVPLAEDRALAAELERCDLKLRHSHAPLVLTSARRSGRAPGGLADLLDCYVIDAATPCDAALEPTAALLRRLCWRRRLRRIAGDDGLDAAANAARRLGYDGAVTTGFGALWSAVETQSPALARSRVMPSTLAGEVALAERWISRIARYSADRADNPASAHAA